MIPKILCKVILCCWLVSPIAASLDEKIEIPKDLFLKTADGKNYTLTDKQTFLSDGLKKSVAMGAGRSEQNPLILPFDFDELQKLTKLFDRFLKKERALFIYEDLSNLSLDELAKLINMLTILGVIGILEPVCLVFAKKLRNNYCEQFKSCTTYPDLKKLHEEKSHHLKKQLHGYRFAKEISELLLSMLTSREDGDIGMQHLFHTIHSVPEGAVSEFYFGHCSYYAIAKTRDATTTIVLIDDTTTREVASIGMPAPVTRLLFAQAPLLIAQTSDALYTVDILTKNVKKIVSAEELNVQEEFSNLCFISHTSTLVFSSGDKIVWHDLSTKKSQTFSTESQGKVQALLASHDGSRLFDVRKDGTVNFWNTRVRKLNLSFKRHSGHIVYSQVLTNALITIDSNRLLCFWIDDECFFEVKIEGSILCVSQALSPIVATALDEGGVLLYNLANKQRQVLFDKEHIVAASYHSGGFFVFATRSGKLVIWDVQQNKPRDCAHDVGEIKEIGFNTPLCTKMCVKGSNTFLIWHYFDIELYRAAQRILTMKQALWQAVMQSTLEKSNPRYNQALARQVQQAYMSDSLLSIALTYYLEEEFPDEYAMCHHILEKVCYQNDCTYNKAAAYFFKALMFLRGDGTAIDYAKARSCFNKVIEIAENKIALASTHNELGHMHLKGLGVPVNVRQAESHYMLAARQDDHSASRANAWLNLGHYYCGENGSPVNHALALDYFQRAANQTSHPKTRAAAEFALCRMCVVGKAMSIDFAKASTYLEAIAQQSDARELCVMAMAYRDVYQANKHLKIEQALEELEGCLENEQRGWVKAMAWVRLGEQHLKLGNLDEAQRLCMLAAEQPHDSEARMRAFLCMANACSVFKGQKHVELFARCLSLAEDQRANITPLAETFPEFFQSPC